MNESVDELRQRWEADPSPQLTLHLAEEYRRGQRLEDAVQVLQRGLEEHPDHVASRVALGRYRLELGQLEEARSLLEQVAEDDPTHLVASKLLVRLHLEAGEEKQARDRLDLYKLLNERDPDIALLEDRLAGRVPAVDESQAEPAALLIAVPRNGDPFEGLWSGLDSEDFWTSLGAEGIFPVASFESAPIAAPVAAPETEGIPLATVTLARLYLQQGHVEEAARAFEEVLAREPDNAQALAGLREVRAPGEPERPADAATRKIEALREYLRRVRAASERDQENHV